MKIKSVMCLLLVCLLLAGCAGKTEYTGDMEKALNYLKWQDYESAYHEANAFLTRVPHSAPAQNIRETAAWCLLDVKIDTGTEIALKDGIAVKTYDGVEIMNLSEDENEKFHLIGYKIETDYDTSYFDLEFTTRNVYLYQMSLYWEYTDNGRSTYEYRMPYPEDLKKADLGEYMLNTSYYGDKMSYDTHEEFVEYLQKVLVASLDDVFGVLAEEYNIAPEHIGFREWNQPAEANGGF